MIMAIDVETKGLDWKDPAQGVFGIAVAYKKDDVLSCFYSDIRDTDMYHDIHDLFKQADVIVNHNIKFDALMLKALGYNIPLDKCECTSVRAALINEHEPSMSLDSLAKKYLGKEKDNAIYEDLAKLFGGKPDRKTQITNLHRAPSKMVGKYAMRDVELAIELWEWQEAEIARQDLRNVCNLEKNLFPVLIDMEWRGVRIDAKKAFQAVADIDKKVDALTKELHQAAGFACNHNPSGDIVNLFAPVKIDDCTWKLRDGSTCQSTPGGKPSINSETLKKMTDPCASLILRLRKLHKTRDTFLNGHIISNLYNGKLHANINQVVNEAWGSTEGTKTGRFSMSRPALQQIPARDKEIAAIIRPLFLPDEGHEWFSVDYRQFEFRIFAHYVNNKDINKMFADNPDMDFHQLVADIAGIPRNATEAGGPNAKAVNLGMIMGMGAGKMAQEMRMPHTVERKTMYNGDVKEFLTAGPEALRVLEQYHAAIPGVAEMKRNATNKAEARGYVFTLAKRRIHYPRKSDCYKAASNIYQGGAADCLKQKLIELHDLLTREGRGRIMLSVHDEVNFSVPKGDDDLKRKIITCMETFDGVTCPIFLRIPIRTDPGAGANWAAASGKGG